MGALSLIVDIITLLPFLGWAVMSIFAIPSYLGEGWIAPVIISIGSTILCGFATRELWLRSHAMRPKFIYLFMDDAKAAA